MSDYQVEFLKVALAHLLAVVSPGPDFAVVLKQSLIRGRRAAIWTAGGIGTAILLHVTYSLFGIGLLLRGSPLWFSAVKYAGAGYIAWLGLQSLRAAPRSAELGVGREPSGGTDRGAYLTGFLTCALNPKASLFFISLFAMVVSPQTPKAVQAFYGGWMAVVTAGWFCCVAVLFTQEQVRRAFLRHGHWIDRALGVVFLLLAARLMLATLN
ncbi:MAG: LysE family translocator [Verrucomicrobiota bacterium]